MAAPMTGKTVLITGANSGIGKAAATELAKQGAQIVMVCRDPIRGETARAEIMRASDSDDVDLLIADLSSQAEIRQLAAEFKATYDRLDVLVNNAGVINGSRTLTVDGLESTFALNHLAYFLLTHELLDVLKASPPARIVNVASMGHKLGTIDFDDLQAEKRYDSLKAYNQSKLANILFTYELARRLAGSDLTTNCLHPGVVATNFGAGNATLFGLLVKLVKPFLRNPNKGAETTVHLASSPAVANVSGQYFVDCRPQRSSRESYDEAIAKRLWETSAALTNLA